MLEGSRKKFIWINIAEAMSTRKAILLNWLVRPTSKFSCYKDSLLVEAL